MNLTVKSAVLAALALGASGVASAVDISTVAAGNVLYSSGSTAIDPVLTDYFINSTTNAAICAGSIDVYSSTVTPKFTAIACTANTSTTGLAANTNIAIIKEDNAGSLNGIQGVQGVTFAGSPYTTGGLQFPTVSQLANSATFCTTSAKAAGSGLAAYTLHTCGTATTAAKVTPALGFADVEAALFGVSATAPVALTATQTVIVPFAPAVSLGLYHALQAVQGKTVGSELVADMPSLPRSVLHGIYSGQVNSWANVQGTSGNAVSAQSVQFGILSSGATVAGTVWNGTTTATGLTTAPSALPSSASVYLCRRGATSGTEKASEWFYDDTGCASVAPYGFVAPSTTITTTLCATVATDGCSWTTSIAAVNPISFPGNGTGDLLDCLVGNDQAGHFAVGFASIDNAPGGPSGQQSKTARQNWRYIRIDGVVPSVENTAAGKWDYFAQSFAYAAQEVVLGCGQDRFAVQRRRGRDSGHAERHGDGCSERCQRLGGHLRDEPGLDRVQGEGGCGEQLPASDRVLHDDDGRFARLRHAVRQWTINGPPSGGLLIQTGCLEGIRAVSPGAFLLGNPRSLEICLKTGLRNHAVIAHRHSLT